MTKPYALVVVFFVLLFSSPTCAQFSSTASHIRYGAATPATCNPATGDVFFKTTATITMYYCSATNTWTALGSGSGTVTGTGVSTNAAFWSSASGLASNAFLVNSLTGSPTTTPTTPILQNSASGANGAFYGATFGTGPSNDRFYFDFTQDSGGDPRIYFVGPSGTAQAFLTPSGSNWKMFGFNTQTFLSSTNCTSATSPAVCSVAPAGSVAVPTGTNATLVVNTTAVTANSQVLLMYDSSLGTKLGVTCNTGIPALYGVSARTAGTSFTISLPVIVATNPTCFSYLIIN